MRRDAGWSSQVARRAHNPEVAGSNPAPATKEGPGNRLKREGRPVSGALFGTGVGTSRPPQSRTSTAGVLCHSPTHMTIGSQAQGSRRGTR